MDIDYYLRTFVNKLRPIELVLTNAQLQNYDINSDKVKFIAEVLNKHDVFTNFKEFDEKNNKKSAEYRKTGNTYFSLAHKDYVRALEYYNQSICYAELNTACLAVGYANRSAIYYEWKLYDECLENIELAFETSTALSDKICAKLQNRKQMCLYSIGNKKVEIGASRPFELSYPAHSRIPFVVESLIMEQNDQFGRFIKTTQDLRPGDCIIIEQASAIILKKEELYKRCAQCLMENNYNLIPCQHCTATMYCSTKCRDIAFTSYHRFECSAINGLITLFNSKELTALNVVLKLFSNLEYLDKTIDYLNNYNKMDSFNFDYKSKYDYADEYKMIHNMVTLELKRSAAEKMKFSFVTAVIYKLLKSNTYLQEIFAKSTPGRQYKDLFLTLIYHNIQSSELNTVIIEALNSVPAEVSYYASGVYPFASLINHSCRPNVVRYVHDQTREQIFIVIGNIPEGEQLFVNYGYNFGLCPKRLRQINLQKLYHFNCVCEACTYDWPLVFELKFTPKLPHIITEQVLNELHSPHDRVYIRKLKSIISNFLKLYDKYLPAAEVFHAREALHLCILFLLQKMPLQGVYKN